MQVYIFYILQHGHILATVMDTESWYQCQKNFGGIPWRSKVATIVAISVTSPIRIMCGTSLRMTIGVSILCPCTSWSTRRTYRDSLITLTTSFFSFGYITSTKDALAIRFFFKKVAPCMLIFWKMYKLMNPLSFHLFFFFLRNMLSLRLVAKPLYRNDGGIPSSGNWYKYIFCNAFYNFKIFCRT